MAIAALPQAGPEVLPEADISEERIIVRLTKREMEVLSLIAEGRTSREVAALLYVSKRTVDFHLARIYEKLQVSNRIQAWKRATDLGILAVAA